MFVAAKDESIPFQKEYRCGQALFTPGNYVRITDNRKPRRAERRSFQNPVVSETERRINGLHQTVPQEFLERRASDARQPPQNSISRRLVGEPAMGYQGDKPHTMPNSGSCLNLARVCTARSRTGCTGRWLRG